MNLRYRGINRSTDVLSFSQIEETAETPCFQPPIPLLGDVVISVDTAERQAVSHHHTLEEELALLAVHGTLHLLGYEDETFEGAEKMRDREREILGIALELANP